MSRCLRVVFLWGKSCRQKRQKASSSLKLNFHVDEKKLPFCSVPHDNEFPEHANDFHVVENKVKKLVFRGNIIKTLTRLKIKAELQAWHKKSFFRSLAYLQLSSCASWGLFKRIMTMRVVKKRFSIRPSVWGIGSARLVNAEQCRDWKFKFSQLIIEAFVR